MAKMCEITGVRPVTGKKISHSNRHTLRRFEPNLQKKRIFNAETGCYETVKVSARGLRMLQKAMLR